MAIIEQEIKLVGSKGEQVRTGLFDSGATYSCIGRDLAERLGPLDSMPSPLSLETAEKGKIVLVKERISLDFYLNGYRFSDEFMIVPHLAQQLIIGAKTMQAWRFKLDFENDKVIIDPRAARLRLL